MGHLQQHRPIGALLVAGPVENQKHIIPRPVDVIQAEVQIVKIIGTVILKSGGGEPQVGEVKHKSTINDMGGKLSLGKRNIIEVVLDPETQLIGYEKVGIKVYGKAVSSPEILPPNALKYGEASPSESPVSEFILVVSIDTGENQ